ncbi:MAG TPA: cyclic nucleotide-binding domain-containing protein [Myxococcales bacterium]|jgi:CRP-like cAMP-binding protein
MIPNAEARQAKDRGATLLAEGKPEEALLELQKAVALVPDDIPARRAVARLLAQLGRKGEAIAAYQHLAGFYAADGQLASAIAISKLILQLDPKHTQTQETISRLYSRQTGEAAASRLEKIPSSMSGALTARQAKAPPAAAPAQAKFTELELDVEFEIDTALLPKPPLFSQLPGDIFLALLGELEITDVHAGQVIVNEGETGKSMYVLAQGRVKVVRELGTRQEKTLATLEKGAFFGEIALLSDAPRLASVVALDECVILEIKREMLAELTFKHAALEPVLQHFYRERLLDNLLRSSPIFATFDDESRHALADHFSLRHVKKGEVLINEGDPSATLHVLLRGCCDVFHVDANGKEHIYPPLVEGSIIGEIAYAQEGIASASVRAAVDCMLLALDPETFRAKVLTNEAAKKAIDDLRAARLKRTADLLLKLGADYSAWV